MINALSKHKKFIITYANKNGYRIVHCCVDIISGVKDNRRELDKILYKPDELPEHQAVIVFKNDRVARDTKLYFYYFYTLEKRNIALLSTEEYFSEGDDFTNIYRSFLIFVPEKERRNIALHTSKGRSIKTKCVDYAGGNKPYAYRVEDGALVINPKEEPIVKIVFSHYDDRVSMTDICEILHSRGFVSRREKRFQVSTIRSILANRLLYQGKYKYGNTGWVQGVHTPIL